jgi:hypothetical protein
MLSRLVSQGVTATRTEPDGPRYGALDADSNLPDVRIVIGAENAFAAEVLDSAGPDYRVALARTGRVFVPAARPRAETWVPDADLRGARDLPVLIVTGGDLRDALTALTEDLADATIDVSLPDGLPGTTEPVDDYSVGVVNQGIPSFVVDTDGTLHLSLMRSCSGWPSGVWIDGPTRTTPDGTSFSWQHWTHTFSYSLVAGEGDWRRAGFVRAGQEVNHAISATEVPASPGDLPSRASLGSVEPESVLLAALKPTGNPIASGLPGTVDPADGVTLRLYESAGQPATARVRLHGGLTDAVATDLLEERAGHGIEAVAGGPTGDVLILPLQPADVVTFRARPAAIPTRPAATGFVTPAVTEPAQPVFTRYWLHNKGPAPIGYLPVSVHVEPTSIVLAPGAAARVRVRVATTNSPASGLVTLDVPAALVVDPPAELVYDLAPGGYAEFDVTVRATDGTRSGHFFLAARIVDELGQLLEDVVSVTVGAPDGHDQPLSATLDPSGLTLAPGGSGALVVRLDNHRDSELRGEAQLLSPYGTWGGPGNDILITPWTQGFRVAPRGASELHYTVRASGTARPGGHWWAGVRIGYFGRVLYTPTVPLTIG